MDVLDHGVQLSGPAVDGDLPGPRSAQLLARQERRESNTRAGRREHQGRQWPQTALRRRLYVDLEPTFGRSLFLKCEGFNFAGSIKLKAAIEIVEAAERDGVLTPRSVLVESSSGNLGVALSMIAASKGYGFLCVTDSRCNCRPGG
jgi:tryptophan synthase beta subunit